MTNKWYETPHADELLEVGTSMIMAQSRNRIPALFLVMALILAALAVGFYLGGARVDSSGGATSFSDFDLLTHRGPGGSGKSCEPHGRYGHPKQPPAHCDGEPGR